MQWLVPLIFVIIFESVADILAKQWSISNVTIIAVASVVAYCISNVFWLFALKDGAGLGRGIIIFSVATTVIATFIGYVLYKENFSMFHV